MGKFDKYTGSVDLDVDGETWTITPSNRQVIKLLSLDKEKVKSEEGLIKMTDALVEMFQAAYPDDDKAKIGAFVMQNLNDITTQLVLKMGWVTQKELDKAIAAETGGAVGKPQKETKKASG